MNLPEGLRWGVATSAYQIEGGRHDDGKGDSIWDRFSDQGRLAQPGDVACDHRHRWREDVALMADLGIDAYRFSVAWTRVLPDGVGAVSVSGLDFYDRLVDELLAHGIEPWLTLYHWDLPAALQDRGGWPVRTTVDAFVEYADVVAGRLGDRVTHWITHNEPWVAAFLGHLYGIFAPGQADWGAALAAGHHLLLSHGRAVEVIRAASPGAEVGLALDCRPARPASDDPADVAATRHFDGFRNRWFFDPVFGKGYPADTLAAYRERGRFDGEVPGFVHDGDLATIAAPIDFVGINYYTSIDVAAGAEEDDDPEGEPGPNPPEGFTEMGWRNTPSALTDFLVRVRDEYGPAQSVITENGASYSDGPGSDRVVDDPRRVAYLDAHIAAVSDAVDAGVPVTGYFVWSLLDNLEWVSGYDQRFGLVWVDHATGERIPKASYHWYRDQIHAAR
ncbi:MAG TPA: GH1 family beta-glucosidase [Acidimicrobiales bacterium]|nr:GH1 family beta-glucosidase [Acidimicrobiales bacterium]